MLPPNLGKIRSANVGHKAHAEFLNSVMKSNSTDVLITYTALSIAEKNSFSWTALHLAGLRNIRG